MSDLQVEPRTYSGSFTNFMIQMRRAQESAYRDWQELLTPGILRHPDRPGEEILNG